MLDYTNNKSIIDEKTNIEIFPNRDNKLTNFSKKLLTDFYLRKDETPQEGFARASLSWCNEDMALAQRLYNAVSKNWFMFASPVLSNAYLPNDKIKGMPISCFLTHIDDTLTSLISHMQETAWLSVLGGGVGSHWSDVRSISDKSPGPIPFLSVANIEMEAYKQGVTRKGSYAAYLNISHPDIMEFIKLRLPASGDEARKCLSTGFNNAVNITDDFMKAVENDLDWNLIDPSDGTIRETIKARLLWEELLEVRYRTGEPYFYFIDTAQRYLPESQKKLGLKTNGSNLCSEITLPTNDERTAVCCLSSLNAEKYDEWKDTSLVSDLVTMLDNVLTFFIEHAPEQLSKAKYSAMRERAIGLGLMGFHSYLQKNMISFESNEAREINKEMFKKIKEQALQRSKELAIERGEPKDMKGTGLRNSHLLAIAPNANSAIISGVSPSVEPIRANAYVHQTRVGSWPIKNQYLKKLLQQYGKDTDEIWNDIIVNRGSVQHLDFLSDKEKEIFKTAIEINQMWIIQHAADRQPYICQSQSINLFFPPETDKEYFSKVHYMAWKKGLKSLYYCRTETKNKADIVSHKIERVALKDGDEHSEEECVSCQG